MTITTECTNGQYVRVENLDYDRYDSIYLAVIVKNVGAGTFDPQRMSA